MRLLFPVRLSLVTVLAIKVDASYCVSFVHRSRPKSTTASGSENDNDYTSRVLQPLHYICGLPSKRVCTAVAVAFNHWLQVEGDSDTVKKVSEIAELLHNASLLVDDIQDGSQVRRGQPAAHTVFGVPRTLNAANFAYFLALERVLVLCTSSHQQKETAVPVFTEQILDLHRGQGMELFWRDTFQCPTEQEYRKAVIKKTGGLLVLAVRLLQLFSTSHESSSSSYVELVSMFGLLYQIRDDYRNLNFELASEGRFGEDITEGKFTFPIVHAVQGGNASSGRILQILSQRTDKLDMKLECVRILEELGSMSYTLEVMKSLEKEMRDRIGVLGGNPGLESLLEQLATH